MTDPFPDQKAETGSPVLLWIMMKAILMLYGTYTISRGGFTAFRGSLGRLCTQGFKRFFQSLSREQTEAVRPARNVLYTGAKGPEFFPPWQSACAYLRKKKRKEKRNGHDERHKSQSVSL